MNAKRSIHEYSTPRPFVLDRFALRSESERDFSVRKAAREAGLKSHVPLLWVLQGKRELHPRHTEWLRTVLSLNDDEATYLRLLIMKDRAKTELDRTVYENAMKGLRNAESPASPSYEIDEEEIIRNPIHASILAATQTQTGISSVEDLLRHFSWVYGKWDLQAAVERLLRHGLLVQEADRLKSVHASTTTKNDRITTAVLESHRNFMALAERRLMQDAPEDREFQSMALAMSRAKTPRAKEKIRAFIREFEKEMEAEPGEEVYQISIQFIRMSSFSPSLSEGSETRRRNVTSAVQTKR